VLHAEVIQYARDDEVDEVSDARRPVVEARRRRKNDRAGLRHAEHVLEMDRAQWRLAWHEHQWPPLLQRDVGGALDERARRPGRDRGQCAHRARADHHSGRPRRPRCRSGAPVRVLEDANVCVPALGADSLAERGH
jgi:hypothetical protein